MADRRTRPLSSSVVTRSARDCPSCSKRGSASWTTSPIGPTGGSAPVLWVAGDGPSSAALARRHPESATVRWLGWWTRPRRSGAWWRPTCWPHPPSGANPSGWSCLEAMAARTVVVASDIDGYRGAAGGRAVLAPPGDPFALAGALSGVLDGTLAGRIGGPGGMAGGGSRAGRPVVHGRPGPALRGAVRRRHGRWWVVTGRTLLAP